MELELHRDVMAEQPPLRVRSAMNALAHCALRTVTLLVRRRLHQPDDHVGRRCSFADGTAAVRFIVRPSSIARRRSRQRCSW